MVENNGTEAVFVAEVAVDDPAFGVVDSFLANFEVDGRNLGDFDPVDGIAEDVVVAADDAVCRTDVPYVAAPLDDSNSVGVGVNKISVLEMMKHDQVHQTFGAMGVD